MSERLGEWKNEYFVSTVLIGRSIRVAIWLISTTENGSTIFERFPSSKVSYKSERCDLIIKSSSRATI